jgi:hypothetical protein
LNAQVNYEEEDDECEGYDEYEDYGLECKEVEEAIVQMSLDLTPIRRFDLLQARVKYVRKALFDIYPTALLTLTAERSIRICAFSATLSKRTVAC